MSKLFARFFAVTGMLALGVAPALRAQLISGIAVHGFVTQGVGSTNGEPVIGLNSNTSANYRNASVQLLGRLTPSDNVVVQFNNQHIGASSLGETDNRFKIEWAFASHRFDNGVTLKAGQLPMPRGIYNEIREVGTLLPFYRAPILSYSEGYETIRGASLTRAFFGETPWEVDATAYTGEWISRVPRYTAKSPTPELRTIEMDHTVGTQLWLATPVSGLRFGLAGVHYHSRGVRVNADSLTPSATPSRRAVVASADGDFERILLRAEVRHQWYLEDQTWTRNYYFAQGGVKLPRGFSLNVQGEGVNRLTTVSKSDSTLVSYNQNKDMALGVRMATTPSMVFKLERHWTVGRDLDRYVAPIEDNPRVAYTLASASFAF